MKKIIVLVSLLLFFAIQTASAESVDRAITAANQWSTGINPYSPHLYTPKAGTIGIFITGTFVATVGLQYSLDRGVTWADLYVDGARKTYTAPAHDVLTDYEPGILYRIGVKTGEYTSGAVNVRLSK